MTHPFAPPTTAPPSPYPAIGEVLDGKYQIERLLGEGGMGAVAKATHLLRRAPVALKFMSPAIVSMSGAVDRFINEGVAASQIDSDHVVKIFDVGRLPSGAPYLVMEYMEGLDLSDLLMKEGTPGLPVARSIHFTLQVLRGLQVAHAAGIVHRDMKPSNCFVIAKDGEPDFVKLLDFGISKVQQAKSASLTRTNSALGTPLYMSPEQAKSPRDVDSRGDLYSVGVILYELLTGRTPFRSESGELTEILYKIFTQDPPAIQSLRPDLPNALCDVIHHALAREPDARFATAAEMGEALAPWADHRSAHVVARMRTIAIRASNLPSANKPSMPVPPPQSIVPSAIEARASQQEVLANTQSATRSGMMSLPAVPRAPALPKLASGGAPRTNAGVARDTHAPSSAKLEKKAPIVLIALAVVAVLGVAAGAMALRKNGTAPSSASTATVEREPPAVVNAPSLPAPTTAETSSANPLPLAPTASASPSASVTAVVSATAKPGPTPVPNVPRPSTSPKPAPAPRAGDLDTLTGKQ